MPTKTTTTPAALPPGLRFSPRNENERVAYVVAASPRLLAVVPCEELEPLIVAWQGATKASEAAQALPVESVDVADELDAQLRAGAEIDPAAVMDRLAEAQEAKERRDRTVQLPARLAGRYATKI